MRPAARFDATLLRPPAPGGARDAALERRLWQWCLSGAGFGAASMAPHPALEAFACALDGSERLARMGRWTGVVWRLQVRLADLLPGRAPQADDPWDCGWLRPQGLARLARWQPRRATLILSETPQALPLLDRPWPKPVRLLVVASSLPPGGPGLLPLPP